MVFEWTKDLSVKNGVIDGQHIQLIAKINELVDALKKGEGKQQIIGIITFLESYIIEHLNYEENYMLKHNYPDIEFHKQHHKILITIVKQFVTDLEKFGPSEYFAEHIKEDLGDWFLNHVTIQDKDYALFIEKNPW